MQQQPQSVCFLPNPTTQVCVTVTPLSLVSTQQQQASLNAAASANAPLTTQSFLSDFGRGFVAGFSGTSQIVGGALTGSTSGIASGINTITSVL